jgi:hypothetical protein
MKQARTGVAALLSVALLVLLPACDNNALPGTMLGTYAVTGTLMANTCGQGLAPPSPWTFSVQMSEQGTTLYWSYQDGNPPLSSPLTTSDSATLTSTESANVDGTADGGLGPCSMTRADTVKIDLGAGSPPPSFTGTLEYDFAVLSGADCTDQLSTSGGTYDALPCKMTYVIRGARH